MGKSITLKHVGYKFEGSVVINCWGGGQGTIEMQSFTGDSLKKEDIAKGINDNGFGCESMECAVVHVYDQYENGYTDPISIDVLEFTAEELKEAKRGI